VIRRLAAILAADVVGYSRLMSEDEAAALEAVKTHRKDVFDPEVAVHGGRIVKLMGDGALVEFPSAVEAVQCAIAVQGKTAAAAPSRIMLRIGVNLGDIIGEGDDIFGSGVNVAVRLQEMAEPGGICVSGVVHEQIEGKIDHHFIDLGSQAVKNIPRPVHVYGDFARVMSKAREPRARPFLDVDGSESARRATGGCLCGDIRYEIVKPAIDSGYCHCKMCQRFSGAPVVAGATFPKDGVRFIIGEPTYYRSSPIAERGFCPRCGSSLTYRPVARRWTDWIFIFGGSLDKGCEVPPEWHLGVESQVSWLSLSDDLPKVRCDESPGLVQAYAEAEKYK
jgi:class 3 adenylate cyclase